MINRIITGTVGFALIVIGFYIVVPTWNLTGNAISQASNAVVTDPSYAAQVNAIGADLTIIIGYTILGMGVGMVVYFLLFAWRRQTITDTVPYGDAY